MTRPLSFLCLAALAACGGKKAPAAASAASKAPAAAEAAMSAEMPDTKAAKSFAEALVGTTVKDWAPVSSDGAEFQYDALNFKPDGSWAAAGWVEAQMERFECTESGKWKIVDAETPTEATMVWSLDKTNCPTREAGKDLRVKMAIDKGSYDIQFR